jgi:hypothetical protein
VKRSEIPLLIREYHERDVEMLRAIHAAQGFDYALPDLRNPLFVTKLVLAEGPAPDQPCHSQRSADEIGPRSGNLSSSRNDEASDKILGAALLRLTAEAYLLLDPRAGTPRERWQWLLALHAAAERDAWHRGLEDVHAWLPPPIAKKFGRRLERIGWRRDDAWTPYCKRLGTAERIFLKAL